MVDDVAKWGLLRGARALVAPSPYEAFSIVVVEALTAGTPVLVNALCGATREHVEQSGAGLWFGDFAEFEVVVARVCEDDALHAAMAANGRRYVEANFRWPVILDRYCGFLEGVAGNGAP
jgi:glycosyltransferase involved in cell wall biosynthesis